MKFIILILALVSGQNLLASQSISTEPKKDSCLVIRNEKKNLLINQGVKIKVRIDKEKFKGALIIVNDSVIKIDENEILLSDIDMIKKVNLGKSIGIYLAQVPILTTGVTLMGITYMYDIHPSLYVLGAGITTGSIWGSTALVNRGNRYKKNKRGKKNKINDVRKWHYSIGAY